MMLRRLESQLSHDDLGLAAYLESARRRRVLPLSAGLLLVALPALVGAQVAMVGALAGSRLLTVVGVLYAVVVPWALVRGWRRSP